MLPHLQCLLSDFREDTMITGQPGCREHLLDIIKSIVQHPTDVIVLEMEGYPVAFQLKVSAEDYRMVLSRLDVISTLASSYAGLPIGQKILLQLLPCDP